MSRKHPSPDLDPEEASLADLSNGEDDVHRQETAVGGWSQAIEEARRAARSAQATAKADKFDLEAAIARAKRNSLSDVPRETVSESPTSGTRRVEAPAAEAPSAAAAVRSPVPEEARSARFRWPMMALLLDLTLILALLLMAFARR